jgi:hypothetical protein
MDDSTSALYVVTFDEPHRSFRLAPEPKSSMPAATLSYHRTDADHLEVEGEVEGARISVHLARFDPGATLLIGRGSTG